MGACTQTADIGGRKMASGVVSPGGKRHLLPYASRAAGGGAGEWAEGGAGGCYVQCCFSGVWQHAGTARNEARQKLAMSRRLDHVGGHWKCGE